jgi:pantetheine-phosphate adenylyltransferase
MNVLVPGTFDPPTLGHIAMIERVAQLFPKVFVAVAESRAKKSNAILTAKQRVDLLKRLTRHYTNVDVISFSGMTVECAHNVGARLIIRGTRNEKDYETEVGMADANRKLGNVETFIIPASPETIYIRASIIREILAAKGSLEAFLPTEVISLLIK